MGMQSPFGDGSGNIALEELRCSGTETTLFQCLRRTRCEHEEDAGVRCQRSVSDTVGLMHNGQMISNNTLLSLNDLGNSSTPLSCVTNQLLCCDSSSGGWFSPGGNIMDDGSENSTELYQSFENQKIQLLRPSGLYWCEIPDQNNVTQTFYVGIYSDEDSENGETVTA